MGQFLKTDQKFTNPSSCEKSVYFTDEVKIKIENVSAITPSNLVQDDKYVNEFKILNNIGKGSFSKVKKVLRKWTDSETDQADIEKYFAMKMMHKPLL